jgi:hypothetical protein
MSCAQVNIITIVFNIILHDVNKQHIDCLSNIFICSQGKDYLTREVRFVGYSITYHCAYKLVSVLGQKWSRN